MIDTVPYFDLKPQTDPLKADIIAALEKTLDSNRFILGPEVDGFEKEFAKYMQSPHAIAFSSGTAALHIAMHLLNLSPGDEVITTPFTFASTAWAISYVGATPVFVDIDETTYTLDPGKIQDAITLKTKAIIAVHLYGHPCDMDTILDICEEHDLYLIEDAAQAHGARYKGQPVGTFGNMGVFSFHPTKNLSTCGEGGALITDQKNLANRARSLRNHGSTQPYVYDEIGYNYRMESMQAAILRIKLKHLSEWNNQRIQNAILYHELLAEGTKVQLPVEAPWAESVYHLYSIVSSKKKALCDYLAKNGIGFSTHYPLPLHLQPCYKSLGYKRGNFPVAERVAKHIINLPLFPGMTPEQVHRVTEVIAEFFKQN